MIQNKDGNFICEKCGEVLSLNFTYDACYCKQCDEWKEEKCDDPDCEYCVCRPDKPSECVKG